MTILHRTYTVALLFGIVLLCSFSQGQPLLHSLEKTPNARVVNTLTSDSLFTALPDSLVNATHGTVAWGDYDNDGKLDLFINGITGENFGSGDPRNNTAKIFRNDHGHFVDIHAPFIGTHDNHAFPWGDYNDDGRLDIAVEGSQGPRNQNPVSKVYRNDAGGFVDIEASITALAGTQTWCDYNNDGKLDLMVTGSPDDGGSIFTKLYRNDGDGKFTEIATPFTGVWGASLAWGDYDNDGKPDLLLSGLTDNYNAGTTRIYHNNGDETFTDINAGLVPVWASCVAWGDYDNDGKLDVIVTGIKADVYPQVPVARIYHNDGNGVFTDIHSPIVGVATGALAWGDYDNDGYLDLAIVGSPDNGGSVVTKVYHNDGHGSFTDAGVQIPGVWYSSICWGDYDNDGYLDLAISGHWVGPQFMDRIFHNNLGNTPHVANTPPTAPEGLTSTVGGKSVELHWDKASDTETPQNGLTYNLRIGTTPGGVDVMSPMADVATGYRKVPQMGNVQENTTWRICNLPKGVYYWSVQAVDNELAGSAFGTERTFTINDTYLVSSDEEVNFGAVKLGSSLSENISLTNVSFTDTLHVDTVTVEGPAFTLDQTPFILLPRQEKTITVSFAPVAPCSYSGLVRFAVTNPGVNPLGVSLKGKGFELGLAPVVDRVYDVPNDNGHQVRVTWYRSTADSEGVVDRATQYSIWRRVDDQGVKSSVLSRKTTKPVIETNGHTYRTEGNILWDFIGTVPAVGMNEYAMVVPTLQDAMPPAISWSVFMVGVQTTDGDVAFSTPDSGYSTDNFPPPAPGHLTATRQLLGAELVWDRGVNRDAKRFRLYRATKPTYQATEGYLLSETSDTLFLDKQVAKGGIYYYMVTAVDPSGNESTPSQMVSFAYLTGVGEKGKAPVPSQFSLSQNYPNPFNPSTTIRFDVPTASHVRLVVYNVLGQEVARLVDGDMAPGYHQAVWKPEVGSGIYFYRIEASANAGQPASQYGQVRKMLFVK